MSNSYPVTSEADNIVLTFDAIGLARPTLEETIAEEAEKFLKLAFPRLIESSVATTVYPNGGDDDAGGGRRARRGGPAGTNDIVVSGELDLDAGEVAALKKNVARNTAAWRLAVSQAITAASSKLQNQGIIDGYVAPELDQINVVFGQLGGRVTPTAGITEVPTTTTPPVVGSTKSRTDKQLTIMVPVLCAVALIAAVLLYIGYRGGSGSVTEQYPTDEGKFGATGGGANENSTFEAYNSFDASFDDGGWGGLGAQFSAQGMPDGGARGGGDTSYLSAQASKSVYLGDAAEQTSWV